MRGHVDRAEVLLHLGGSGLLDEPGRGHAAALDDAGVALHAGNVADTEAGAEHGVAQGFNVAPLRDSSELLALGRGGDVVVVEGTDTEQDGRDTEAGEGLAGLTHLLLGLLAHLGLETGQALARRFADELGEGEALQLLLLGGGQRTLRQEGALRGLFDLRLTELLGERFNLGGQSVTLGGVGLRLRFGHLGPQVGSNFVRFSHCFVSFMPVAAWPWRWLNGIVYRPNRGPSPPARDRFAALPPLPAPAHAGRAPLRCYA